MKKEEEQATEKEEAQATTESTNGINEEKINNNENNNEESSNETTEQENEKIYLREEAIKEATDYFDGDEMAADVWVNKYALKDTEGNLYEKNPDQMHKRISKDLSRIENKYPNPLSEKEIYDSIKNFGYIVPQGSPMAGIGNDKQHMSLSNCFVIGNENDSYGGIMRMDQELVQLQKRRAGVGLDISHLRPSNTNVKNAALTSTGAASFMERFSNSTREVAQCIEENQRVLTDNGLKPIKYVNNDDKVWTKRGWINVIDKLNSGEKQVFKITTKFGFTIEASEDHLFYASHGKEKKLRNLNVGDSISLINGNHEFKKDSSAGLTHNNFEPTKHRSKDQFGEYGMRKANRYKRNLNIPDKLNSNIAYILGFAEGDGYVEYKNNIPECLEVSCEHSRKNIEEKIINLTEDQFNNSPSIRKGSGKLNRIKVCGQELCVFLEENNMLKNKSEHCRIPEKVWESNSDIQASFLSGLFDSDGYASGKKKGYVFNTTSKKLADDIQIMLMSLGVLSKKTIETNRGPNSNWKDLYKIVIVGGVNQKRFVNLLNESEKVKYVNRVSKKDLYKSPFTIEDLNVSRSNYNYIPDKGMVSINCLDRCEDYNDAILTLDEVVSIEKIGDRNTFDLSLESEHLFWCEGFYVHNSGRRGALMQTISIEHPDSEEFIDMKTKKGKVTGANVSVRVTDDFIEAVKNNETFVQKFPIDSEEPEITKEVDAKRLFKKIVNNNWEGAEPGFLYWDHVIRESIPDNYSDHEFNTRSTNPCLVGDTKVAVADGRGDVAIRDLAKEGMDVPVYCKDENDNVTIRTMRNPRITGYKEDVYKVTLDDGNIVRVTGNHKFKIKNGDYKKTIDLNPGDSLDVLTKWENPIVKDNVLSKKDYIWLNDGKFSKIYSEHNLIAEYYNNNNIKVKKGEVVHHIDEDPRLLKTLDRLKEQGYECMIQNGDVLVKKYDELTKEPFWIHHERREVSFKNIQNFLAYKNNNKDFQGKRLKRSDEGKKEKAEYNKNKQLKVFTELKYELGRNPFLEEWENRCREYNIPFRLKTKHGFKNFKELKSHAESYNHRVVSVEYDGKEDVYNGTVDEYHNFYIGGFESETRSGKRKSLYINNLQCGEITLSESDSCRLTAMNLYSFVQNPFTKDAYFDLDLFYNECYKGQKIMDDIIDIEIEKVDDIINKIDNDPEDEETKKIEKDLWKRIRDRCEKGRRTGLGVTAMGDTLAALGYTYGTDEANKMADTIHRTLKHAAYESSADMAKDRGIFPIWEHEREKDNPFLNRIKKENEKLYEKLKNNGRRNIALLTVAPTGSVSIMTQTTSGLEPAFLISYKRRRKINPNDKGARSDFVDDVGDHWQEYNVFHHKFIEYLKIQGYNVEEVKNNYSKEAVDDIVKNSPYYKATSNDVDWVKKVEMQGMVQDHVDHSISVTVNLPNDITKEMVEKVYIKGYEVGCKGMTIYRDGSRSGVLVSEEEKKEKEKEEVLRDTHSPKRPKRLEADVVRFQNNKEKWIAVVGLYNNRPYEIFTGKLEGSLNIPTSIEKGTVVKVKENGHSRYDFEYTDKDGYKMTVEGLSRTFDPEYWNYAKLISGVLRHGMPLQYVYDLVESLNLEDHLSTWKKGIARVIKKYIPEGTKYGKCPNGEKDDDCGLVFKEGCLSCDKCGVSKC